MQLDDLIGKPYKIGAIGPEFYDCYGLALEVRSRAEMYFPKHQMTASLKQSTESLNAARVQASKLKSPLPYCIVTFRPTGKFVTHIGIVLPNLYQFIHIIKKQSVCIERLDSIVWRSKIEGYYEFSVSNSI